MLRDVFPDWTAEDLVFALQEVDGDVDLATDRIATGIYHTIYERREMLIGRSCFAVGTSQEEIVEGETERDRKT